jgi:hypothetical protein
MRRSKIPVCLRRLRTLCGLIAWSDSGMHAPVPCTSTKLYETSFSCLGYRRLQSSCADCGGHGNLCQAPLREASWCRQRQRDMGSNVIVPEAAEKTVWAKPYRTSTSAHDLHLLRSRPASRANNCSETLGGSLTVYRHACQPVTCATSMHASTDYSTDTESQEDCKVAT